MINHINYALLASRLDFDIELPLIHLSAGEFSLMSAYAKIISLYVIFLSNSASRLSTIIFGIRTSVSMPIGKYGMLFFVRAHSLEKKTILTKRRMQK